MDNSVIFILGTRLKAEILFGGIATRDLDFDKTFRMQKGILDKLAARISMVS